MRAATVRPEARLVSRSRAVRTAPHLESYPGRAEDHSRALPSLRRQQAPVTARLIVRWVRRLRPRDGQLELNTYLWRHHTVLTDRPELLLTAEAEHRAHAVIADLKNSAMAHLPSGNFNANAAWLALAALAHNLTRALATLAGHGERLLCPSAPSPGWRAGRSRPR